MSTWAQADAGSAARSAAEDRAEVEITGTLKIAAKPAKLIAFVSRRPCSVKHLDDALGTVTVDPNVATNFFIEIFVPQGTTGHICAAGLDGSGNAIAFGSYSKNPVTFRGKGEISIAGVIINLKPLNAPAGAKKTHL